MKVILLTCTYSNEDWLVLFERSYAEKIGRYIPFDVVNLSVKGKSRENPDEKKDDEAKAILNALKPDDFVALFDERGKNFTSRQFAEKIQSYFNLGKKRIVFIVGGAFGVSDLVKQKCDVSISMSSFVLNHHVAKAVALEQIYRSMTILKNTPYHND